MRPATVLALIGTCLIACSAQAASLSPDDEAAREVALQWLQLVDSGDYDHAVLQTAEQIGVQQHWMAYLSARRSPLGPVKHRQTVEVKHKPTVHGAQPWWKYKVIRFKTSFEHKPAAMEEVVLTKMSCCWEVSGYTIFESGPDGHSESDPHSGKWNDTREHAGMFSDK